MPEPPTGTEKNQKNTARKPAWGRKLGHFHRREKK